MPGRAKILLIHNPAAGRAGRDRVAAVVASLARRGFDVTVRATGRAGDAGRIAAGAGAVDMIVAAGGDGTVNEIVGGLGEEAPVIAVLPLGTANVLAAELGLTADAERFADAVAAGRTVTAWPAEVNGRSFMLMAGIGFDAEVVAAVSPAVKRRLGKAAYALAALRVWLAGRQTAFRVTIDGATHRVAGVVVCKSRFYGGRFVLAPAAGIDTPLLFAVLMPGGRRRDRLRYAWAMLRGRLHAAPDVRVIAARQVLVEADAPAPVQIDGDIGGVTPAVVAIAGRAVRFIKA
jgi:YegS/Rv2252/BmrU family lipid kinase